MLVEMHKQATCYRSGNAGLQGRHLFQCDPCLPTGSIPGVSADQMKLQIKIGVPRSLHGDLRINVVKTVFRFGEIVKLEVVDGGLICSNGMYKEPTEFENDDCCVVNAVVYVGY
ncbi:uncharacterized protein LOC130754954 [Actinidia eriantha]|uniref:uncharacterized protein LOC130754954 n=1 Tax=Actinidia eriantha TaxID=165200 RepID=UPI00258980CA|nr:uncharacterized protein LOC130754954 [Actinidia eriantha]